MRRQAAENTAVQMAAHTTRFTCTSGGNWLGRVLSQKSSGTATASSVSALIAWFERFERKPGVIRAKILEGTPYFLRGP